MYISLFCPSNKCLSFVNHIGVSESVPESLSPGVFLLRLRDFAWTLQQLVPEQTLAAAVGRGIRENGESDRRFADGWHRTVLNDES